MQINSFDTIILEGRKGMKVEVFLFSPSVPDFYRQRALNMLGCFMDIGGIREQDVKYISGSIGAYLENNVEEYGKYFLTLNVFVQNGAGMEDYFFQSPILPEDKGFPEFQKCIMEELSKLLFW